MDQVSMGQRATPKQRFKLAGALAAAAFAICGPLGPSTRVLAAESASLAASPKDDHFIPKFGPLKVFSDPGLTKPAGELPPQPTSFPIAGAQGEAYQLSVPDGSGARLVFVRSSEGFIARRPAVLRFNAIMSERNRAPLRVWLKRRTIEDFLARGIGDLTGADMEERVEMSATADKALPLIDEAVIHNTTLNKKIKLYNVAFRLPFVKPMEAEAANVEKAQVLLLVDASASMKPLGSAVLAGFMDRVSAQDKLWKDRIRMATFLFKETDAELERVRLDPFRPVDEVKGRVARHMEEFEGGGDDAEPLLDALYMAAKKVPWGYGRPAKGLNRVIVAFASVDIHAKALGQDPYGAAPDLTFDKIAAELNKRRIGLLLVQSTPEPGEHLLKLLAEVKAKPAAGVAVEYGRDTHVRAMDRLKEFLALEDVQQALKERNDAVARKTAELSGVALAPFRENFAQVVAAMDTGNNVAAEWVNVPFWIVSDESLFRLE
ncbi:MAG: hypothetical protein NW215_01490 [Hyphomicrobiales bacterium]|nr:hypothetical protein [Hyphomicrobiales bacterium]